MPAPASDRIIDSAIHGKREVAFPMRRTGLYLLIACGALIAIGGFVLTFSRTKRHDDVSSTVLPTAMSASAVATAQAAQQSAIAALGLPTPPVVTPPSLATLRALPTSPGGPPGGTAIHPTLSGTDPATPNFTAADVRAYFAAQQAPGTTPQYTITDIVFMTSDELQARMGRDPKIGANRLVCVVQMSGTFTHSAFAGATPFMSDVAFKVFDAHTGNLLIESEGQRVI